MSDQQPSYAITLIDKARELATSFEKNAKDFETILTTINELEQQVLEKSAKQ